MKIQKKVDALENKNYVVHKEEVNKNMDKPTLELKVLPTHLKYIFLDLNVFPIIISAYLTDVQEQRLIELLRKYKKAIGRTIVVLQWISPAICMHQILLVEELQTCGVTTT